MNIYIFLILALAGVPVFSQNKISMFFENKKYQEGISFLDNSDQSKMKPDEVSFWYARLYQMKGLEEYQKGEYEKARLSFLSSLSSEENEYTLFNLAMTQSRLKEYFHANMNFEKSISMAKNGDLKKNAVLEMSTNWIELGNLKNALYELKKYHQESPRQPDTLKLLAKVQLQNRDPKAALETLETLEKAGFSDSSTQELQRLANSALLLQGKTIDKISCSFEISTSKEISDPQRDRIIEILSHAWTKLGSVFQTWPDGVTRVIVLLSEDFSSYTGTPEFVLGLKHWTSGELVIRMSKMQDGNLLENILWHEYVHHLIRIRSGKDSMIPSWFHEGAATWLEPNQDQKSRKKILEGLIQNKMLFDSQKGFPASMRTREDYVQAASIIQFLDEISVFSQMIDKLNQIDHHYNFHSMLTEITRWTEVELLTRWQEWLLEKLTDSHSE